jgi:hypothetical protein
MEDRGIEVPFMDGVKIFIFLSFIESTKVLLLKKFSYLMGIDNSFIRVYALDMCQPIFAYLKTQQTSVRAIIVYSKNVFPNDGKKDRNMFSIFSNLNRQVINVLSVRLL